MAAAVTPRAGHEDLYLQRRLTSEDREGIVELARHTYDGNDWIVDAFDNKWFSSSDGILAVVLISPTSNVGLVALEVAEAVDEGSTIWLSALRVHPTHQGRGLARRIQRVVVREALAEWPRAQRVRYATGCNNFASLRIADACGLSPVPVCSFSLLHADDVQTCIRAICDQTAESGVALAACAVPLQKFCEGAVFYPLPDAAVLGSWKIVNPAVYRSSECNFHVQHLPGAGFAACDDSLSDIRAISFFFDAQSTPDCDGLLKLVLLQLENSVSDKPKSLHLFTPLEFKEQWTRYLSMNSSDVFPAEMIMVDGSRDDVAACVCAEHVWTQPQVGPAFTHKLDGSPGSVTRKFAIG